MLVFRFYVFCEVFVLGFSSKSLLVLMGLWWMHGWSVLFLCFCSLICFLYEDF